MTPAGAPVPGGPGAIRAAAHRILARPEFQPTPESPLTRARTWVVHELGRLIAAVLAATPHGVLGALMLVVVVTALVALTVRALRATGAGGVHGGMRLDGARRPPEAWLADAARYEASGDWRSSLRCRYRALVAELARRGVVDELPGRTTGEYRAAVDGGLPGRRAEFGDATVLFESAWYGDDPTAEDTVARMRRLADDVLRGVP